MAMEVSVRCIEAMGISILLVAALLNAAAAAPSGPATNDSLQKDEEPPYASYPFGKPTSELGIYRHAAVSTGAISCAEHGLAILKKGGNAVDAAIGSVFCNEIVHPYSTGIGGGFFMTIYKKEEGKAYYLDAREVAPLASTEEMFVNESVSSSVGPLSIAVPGQALGLFEAKEQHGNPCITMADLLDPLIAKCRTGIEISKSLAKAIKISEKHILKSEEMSKMFVNPETKQLLGEGDTFKRPVFADTLELLKTQGASAIYDGELGRKIVEELKQKGGIITMEDLKAYSVEWKDPAVVQLKDGMTMYSSPPPGSGAVTEAIVKLMDMLPRNETLADDPKTYQLLTEAMKFSFARRSKIGDNVPKNFLKKFLGSCWMESTFHQMSDSETNQDPTFYGLDNLASKDDHGTSHVSVLDAAGNAVGVTSTLNYYFGSKVVSPSTGIIFNDEMDDFSTDPKKPNLYGVHPSKANLVQPGMRPTSSMSPSIVVDENNRVRLVIGAAGGPHIISSTAFVTMQHLLMGKSVKAAMDFPRIHHQLLPMQLKFENGLPKATSAYLERAGHEMKEFHPFTRGGGRVQAIAYDPETDVITANSDSRKDGEIAGY